MRKKFFSIMFMLMSFYLVGCQNAATPKSTAEVDNETKTTEVTTASEKEVTVAITEEKNSSVTENTSAVEEKKEDASSNEDTSNEDTSNVDTSNDDSNNSVINYPSGYFEDDVDIVLEMDADKTQENLVNSNDIYELFGSSLHMGAFLGIEDNGYFLMTIGSGVYYEGTWELNDSGGFVATCQNMNSGGETSIEVSRDSESGYYVTTVYGEKVYWKHK